MLNNFGSGWRDLFEKHLEYVSTFLPDTTLSSVERYKGMLRIKFTAPNEHIQYLLDSFTYKIERDSARTCELCGNYGFRRDSEWFSGQLCLCTPCLIKHVDSIVSQQK